MFDDTRPFDLDPSIFEVEEIADAASQPSVTRKSLAISDEVTMVKKRPRGKNWSEADSLLLIEAWSWVEANKKRIEHYFIYSDSRPRSKSCS